MRHVTTALMSTCAVFLGAASLSGAGGEVGTNDFRLSSMGGPGDPRAGAFDPAIAYSPEHNEFLVAWVGDDVPDEGEVYAQRLDAVSGRELTPDDLRISDVGLDGSPAFGPSFAAVTYNPDADEYLVVWRANEALSRGDEEIYGQRIDAASGLEIGPNDFRISDMGPEADPDFNAWWVAVSYNRVRREYLVAWAAEDDVEGRLDIFGQRLDGASGAEVGANDFRISMMGVPGDPDFDAARPVVAYDADHDEYLVVWDGNGGDGLHPRKVEVFAQRLSGASGDRIGPRLRVSQTGDDLDPTEGAFEAAIAFDPRRDEFVVAWETFERDGGGGAIRGQRLEAGTGAELGEDDFRVSDLESERVVSEVALAWSGLSDQYVVAWSGVDAAGEGEIYGQRLGAGTGERLLTEDAPLSTIGPGGDPEFGSRGAAVAWASGPDEVLATWWGYFEADGLFPAEIFGQRLLGAGGIGGAVDGIALGSARCENLATGERVRIAPRRGSSWSCSGAELGAETGDPVRWAALGEARTSAAGGSAAGLTVTQVVCRNLTSGQTVEPPPAAAWDCSAAGLAVAPGDRLAQMVEGKAE